MEVGDSRPVDPTDVLDSSVAGTRVIRGGALRTVTYGAGVLISIAAAALMTRHLGVRDFGRYATVISLIGIVSGVSEAGLSNIAVREYAVREGDDRRRWLQNLFGLRALTTVVGVAAATAFAAAAGYAEVMVVGTAIAGLGVLFSATQQTIATPLSAGLRFVAISVLDLIRQLATVVLVVALVILGARLLPFLAMPVAIGLLLLVLTIPLVRGQVPLVPALDRDMVGRILKLMASYSAASAVGTIYVFTPMIVTSIVASSATAGYFGASFRIFQTIAAVPVLLVTSAFPILVRAARDDEQRFSYAVDRLSEMALIIGTWMAIATFFIAPWAIDVVAGSKFEPAARILRIHGLALAIGFLAMGWGFALLSLGRFRALLVANALAFSLSVTLTAVLVPSVGARAGAIATIAADLGLIVVYGATLLRERIRPSVSVAPRVAVAAGAAAAIALVPHLSSLPRTIAAIVVYGLVLALLRGFPPELRQALIPGTGE